MIISVKHDTFSRVYTVVYQSGAARTYFRPPVPVLRFMQKARRVNRSGSVYIYS